MAVKQVESQTSSETITVSEDSKADQAAKAIRKYALGTAGAGLIPLPLADVAIIAGVQLKLIHALCKIYDVKFTKDLGKSAVASLIGGLASHGASGGLLGSFIKSVPGVGTVLGVATVPVIAGASTYALGQVFRQHFESGGTFLDFDPEATRAYFSEQFEKSKAVVTN
jgi:uncharacterized protein (DUF697 family)